MSLDFGTGQPVFPSVDTTAPNATEAISTSHFLYLLDFLNASRTGAAQQEAGISFQTFISSLSISVLYCVFEVIVYSLLRTKLRNVYMASSYFKLRVEKRKQEVESLFGWVTEAFQSRLTTYKAMGLDSYFFLRYLRFLCILFLGLALINLPVLIPTNYASGYQNYTPVQLELYANGTAPMIEGLDRISMSNIAPLFTRRLSVHLTMAVVSVFWFHGLVIVELRKYICTKNEYMSDESNFTPDDPAHDYNNTILISNVPQEMLNREELTKLFDKLCGARIKNIWFVYKYGQIRNLYKKELQNVDQMEHLLTTEIHSKFFLMSPKALKSSSDYKRSHLKHILHNLKYIQSIKFDKKTWRPCVVFRSLAVPLLEAETKLIDNRASLSEKKTRFIKRDHSPLLDHRYNKVFIQFRDPLHAEILNQIQISGLLNELDKTVTFINPKDLLWHNLSERSNMLLFMRVVVGNFLSCIVILGWVVPVAFIGLISQLPYLTLLIPFLSWLNLLPTYITDVISNYLSVILLMCLSEVVPYIFRHISSLKGKITGAQVELDVQRWMFVFLFIHIFLVVTISSGYTVIVEGLVNNPVSIPNILATNLPKCSNFFFSYITIRGLSYCGNNLIQNYELFCSLFVYPWTDFTPRQKFKRSTNVPEYKWGSIYPTFAVLGCIGLIYSIVSPLIVVFCLVLFSLVLLSFKCTIMKQYCRRSVSENFGQHFPTALFQLYAGIYFMEACLIGIFALSRDAEGYPNSLPHAFLAFLLVLMTAAGQTQIQKMFKGLTGKKIPLTMTRTAGATDKGECKTALIDDEYYNDTFYEPCFHHFKHILWMPKDLFNISLQEIFRLSARGIESSNTAAFMNEHGEIEVVGYPPDHGAPSLADSSSTASVLLRNVNTDTEKSTQNQDSSNEESCLPATWHPELIVIDSSLATIAATDGIASYAVSPADSAPCQIPSVSSSTMYVTKNDDSAA